MYYILQIDGPENVDVTGNSNLICNPIMQDAAGRSVLCIYSGLHLFLAFSLSPNGTDCRSILKPDAVSQTQVQLS
jgi:hypothetical protein